MIITSIAYLTVVPIILKVKVSIHDTLVLFTKISMKDIDYF